VADIRRPSHRPHSATASTRTNKEAASRHPNHILFSCATMVAPSLLVTVCVSYGISRGRRIGDPSHLSRPNTQSSIPSTCPDTVVRTRRSEALSYLLGPMGRGVFVRQLQRPSPHSEAPLLGVGREIGSPCVVLAVVCRDPARPHGSLSSSIEPYVLSPLPTPEEP
jgi:hypothetical protein